MRATWTGAAVLSIMMPLLGPGRAEGPDLAHLEATRARPLFSPTRRPPPPQPVPPPAPVATLAPVSPDPPPPDLQLSGVVIGEGRTIAIVTRPADAKIVTLEVGRAIDGWTVTAIRAREVDLTQGTRSLTIRLARR